MLLIIIKLKKICKHAVKLLPYLLRCVPDRYKTQKCVKKLETIENGETLVPVLDCCKNQKMCNKAVDNYLYVLEFVPECFMTQRMCDKAFTKCFLVFFYIPGQ